jgi:hypothetical protein
MSPLPRNFLLIVFALSVMSNAVFAQTPPGPPPKPVQRPIPAQPPAVDQEQAIAYWTTETGWTSELQLRNNAVAQDLTVTPVLRLADGAETSLAPVTIKPQEVKSIDLGAAIFAAAAPQLVGTYGSVVLQYRSPSLGSLYAALMVRSVGHPFAFHIDAKGEMQGFETGSREGIWWLPKETASDYLILTNQGKNVLALDLSLYDASGKQARQKVLLAPAETTRYSIRKLILASGLTGSYGGIKIATSAHAGSLNTLHFLFDETAGFSAILKMFDYHPEAKLEERVDPRTEVWTLRAPMLALTAPDPSMAFPPGTTLQPQLLVRNTTGKAVDAALRFNWRSASGTGKAPGPTLHLNPFETRRIDVAALQNGGTLPKAANWTSVMLATSGLPDEVMAVAASYDATLRYGAQTPFSDQLSPKWEGGMWEYDPYHSSIITAGNGGTKPTQAAFTIFYNQGTQRYDLEQTLQPDEQMWIDVGKLIREQVPDKNGKVLPADLTSGSYEFRDLTDFALGALFEGKVIYDKTYGHAAYGCANCCGTMSTQTWFNPLGVPSASTAGQGVNGYNNCDLTWDDVSSYFYSDWTSSNTAIATVDYYGTHSGVSAGSTRSTSWANMREGSNGLLCPRYTFRPSGGVNTMTLSCPASVTRAGSATCSVSSAPTGATFSNWKFTDSSNNTVTNGQNTSSWSGTMVTSGTVSVTVATGGGSTPLSASITVTNRSWHTAPATPAEVANGTFITLPVPPQNTGTDSGLGYFQWHYVLNSGSQGLQYSTLNDNGPNQGYTYWPSNQIFSTWNAQYEINPDLENTASTFYQEQCGRNGWILGSNLLTQTNRHEWNSSTQSHDALYSTSLNSNSNNPGDFLEQQIAPPGADLNTFAQNSTSGINNRLTTVSSASENEAALYPVNYSETGNILGNINYGPSYGSCN